MSHRQSDNHLKMKTRLFCYNAKMLNLVQRFTSWRISVFSRQIRLEKLTQIMMMHDPMVKTGLSVVSINIMVPQTNPMTNELNSSVWVSMLFLHSYLYNRNGHFPDTTVPLKNHLPMTLKIPRRKSFHYCRRSLQSNTLISLN